MTVKLFIGYFRRVYFLACFYQIKLLKTHKHLDKGVVVVVVVVVVEEHEEKSSQRDFSVLMMNC